MEPDRIKVDAVMYTTEVFRFWVAGVPQPGGSKKAIAYRSKSGRLRANVLEDAKHNAAWRSMVSWAAGAQKRDGLLEGPLFIKVIFVMPRPKSHYRANGALKQAAPKYPVTKPDATKLLRSTEDALTGILWKDDAQIAYQMVRRIYGEQPGALVEVGRIRQ